jgi:hypothetical protein
MKLTLAYMPFSIILLLVSGCAQLGIFRLELQALPQEGRAPLTVSFVAEIKGGLDVSPELYCQTQTETLATGGQGVYAVCAQP